MNRCEGSSCQPSSIIEKSILGITANVAILNSYLDFNDYDTPVKSYLDDRASFYLLSAYSKVAKVYAKLNKAILDDDYLKIKSATTKEFFSVDRVENDVGSFDYEVVAQVGILLDPNRDTYKRTVFTILDLSGTLGGIFGLLSSAWGFIIGMISTQIMYSSVFRRLYYTNNINFQSLAVNILNKSKKVSNMLYEEEKEHENKTKTLSVNSRIDDARNYTDIDLQYSENQSNINRNRQEEHMIYLKNTPNSPFN